MAESVEDWAAEILRRAEELEQSGAEHLASARESLDAAKRLLGETETKIADFENRSLRDQLAMEREQHKRVLWRVAREYGLFLALGGIAIAALVRTL